ncbi:MAG: glycosyltransferase [Salinivirgaceae bacterium]|jgi:hypothetical protein|nr:glycosyltransferase [Salinivirgaceae bacterium]
MKDSHINIVSFNVPYPANYGGIIDVFYKLKALHDIGVHVYLHCFDYGRGDQTELNKYCKKVYYYKRKTGLLYSLKKMPYIVFSRSNKKLLNNLLTNDYPIIFEGLHTCYFLDSHLLKNRTKIVRAHNIEHQYYHFLQKQEPRALKRLYFKNAARKLEKYESILNQATNIAAISPNDFNYFNSNYQNAFWLPPFHPNNDIKVQIGSGNYALYHGNLSVPENIKAAIFLIGAFSNAKNVNIIFAGKNPSSKLDKAIKEKSNMKIVANPSYSEMNNLIADAHIHLLPTFQPTGIKLKLIASLFAGRHCIVNNEMIVGTGLENLCHRANSENEFIAQTDKLMKLPFENKDLILRKEVLSKRFDNKRNAELILAQINKVGLQP